MILQILYCTIKKNAPNFIFGFKNIPYLGYVIAREVIQPDKNKGKEIMDLSRPTTTTKDQALIGMVQYYRDMWPRWYHIQHPLKEASRGPKGRNFFGMTNQKVIKKRNDVVFADTLLSDPDQTIPFTVHTDASYKQLCDGISQNNKPIAFFSRILINTQHNYTMTQKGLLTILECLQKFCGIIFGYK